MGAFVGTIQNIEEVGLDNLVFAHVKGFKSLIPRNTLHIGDKVIFIEPDSVLPDREWAASYKKYAPKRVKPIKIRGFLTEGIIIPLVIDGINIAAPRFGLPDVTDDTDVSDLLGVTHYEPPTPTEKGAVGYLPYWLPKTDEIRWEHLPTEAITGDDRLVTLKIDGSSCTFIVYKTDDTNVAVYSRSQKYDDDGHNKYSRVLDNMLPCGISLRDELYDSAVYSFLENNTIDAIVFRGELFGENIQRRGKNPHADGPLSWLCYGRYAYMNNKLHKMDVRLSFCETSALTVPNQTMAVTENFINGVMEGAGLPFAPEMYEGVVVHFPPCFHKGREYTSCKIINKAYDALV